MENITAYTFPEVIALVSAVTLGSGAYISFIVSRKKQEMNTKTIVLILVMNGFLTYIASEALKLFNWGGYRSAGLPVVAFIGQYLLDWIDRRKFKLFDWAARRGGIDLKDDEDETDTKDN